MEAALFQYRHSYHKQRFVQNDNREFSIRGVTGPDIPTTGGIWVNGGTLLGNNFTVTNDGWIRITSGIANFGTAPVMSSQSKQGLSRYIRWNCKHCGRLENTASILC